MTSAFLFKTDACTERNFTMFGSSFMSDYSERIGGPAGFE